MIWRILPRFLSTLLSISPHLPQSLSKRQKKFPNTYAPWRALLSVWQPGDEWNVSRQRMSTHKSQLWFRQILRGGKGNIKAKVKSFSSLQVRPDSPKTQRVAAPSASGVELVGAASWCWRFLKGTPHTHFLTQIHDRIVINKLLLQLCQSSVPNYDFSAQPDSGTRVLFFILLLQVQLFLEQKD